MSTLMQALMILVGCKYAALFTLLLFTMVKADHQEQSFDLAQDQPKQS